jgi:hypothetical protein
LSASPISSQARGTPVTPYDKFHTRRLTEEATADLKNAENAGDEIGVASLLKQLIRSSVRRLAAIKQVSLMFSLEQLERKLGRKGDAGHFVPCMMVSFS